MPQTKQQFPPDGVNSVDSQKIEREFHDQLWATTNLGSSVERAISEARILAYSILGLTEADSAHHAVAEVWLENYGRDRRRELARPPEHRKVREEES